MRVLKALFRFGLQLIGAGMLAVAGVAIVIYIYLVPELPSTASLKDVQFQVPLRVYSSDGKLMAEFGEKRRVPLTREQIPEAVIQAVIASEDQYFYQHPGVDWRGLARAVWHIVRTGSKGPGGSTITMQVARNFFLSREKTYLRKLNEILLSLQIERDLSKDEILELYLNKIFLGHRAYGIGAAAEVYYGKSVDELDLAQVAMLAGLPQRPSADNPVSNPERALARRGYVLTRMLGSGFITPEQYKDAKAAPVTASLHNPIVEFHAPYLAEMARAFVEAWAGDRAYSDGFSVHTTVDSRMQMAATKAVRDGLMAYDRRHGYRGAELTMPLEQGASPREWESRLRDLPPVGTLRAALVLAVGEREAKVYVRGHGEVILPWEGIAWARMHISENRLGPELQAASEVLTPGDVVRVHLTEEAWHLAQVPKIEGALVSLDPRNGSLTAIVGGFDFFRSKFNRAAQAERQPGSSFKPFIYSAALEKGFTAASMVNDAPVVFDDPRLEASWRPENYSGKSFGPTRLRLALTKSRNLVSIRLLRSIGINYAMEHVDNFGFDTERLPRDLSLSLGSGTLKPIELATGYAVLANGGYAVEPYFVDRIEDSRGVTLYEANPTTVCRECPDVPRQERHPGGAFSMPASAKLGAPAAGARNAGLALSATGGATSTTPTEGVRTIRIAPRAVSERNTWLVSSMLRDVIRHGTGRRALALKRRDIAGKTGTTNDQRDAWFSGFVPSLVTTAWVGFDKLAPLGRRETGGRAALPIWIDFMREALAGVPEEIPPAPPGMVSVRINKESGELASAGEPEAMFETFRSEMAPRPTSNRRYRSPAGGGRSANRTARGPAPKRAEKTTKRLF